jgi:pyruvate/2-oxoglutarate dehydrogenase complex dihydrolipoamide acyltransferase (E2) component
VSGRVSAPSAAELKAAFGTFFVPRLYEDQERERIHVARWLAEPGDKVERGQDLVALETPRGTYKVAAPAKGVLQRRARAERDRVELGDVLGAVEIDPEAWKAEYGK